MNRVFLVTFLSACMGLGSFCASQSPHVAALQPDRATPGAGMLEGADIMRLPGGTAAPVQEPAPKEKPSRKAKTPPVACAHIISRLQLGEQTEADMAALRGCRN